VGLGFEYSLFLLISFPPSSPPALQCGLLISNQSSLTPPSSELKTAKGQQGHYNRMISISEETLEFLPSLSGAKQRNPFKKDSYNGTFQLPLVTLQLTIR
jgi:hypothetical protein